MIKNIFSKFKKIKLNKKYIILFLIFFLFLSALWHTNKPLPKNINYLGSKVALADSQIEFLHDLTYLNDKDEIIHEQKIFDEIIENIENAQEYILVDMFLFNSWLGKATTSYRSLAGELTNALIEQKNKYPDLKIDLITDPINIVYGGDISPELESLKKSGVNIIITNLKPLRDSNPVYSTLWRTFLQWLGNHTWPKWIKHPFSETENKVSLRSYLALLNFKANHRKTFLADHDKNFVSIIMSANPHNSSSAHSNVAMKIIDNNFAHELWQSEQAVAQMSKIKLSTMPKKENNVNIEAKNITQLITEKQIKNTLVSAFDNVDKDDEINMAMFYLSNRSIVKSLIKASKRGVNVKIILDSNRDAFGYEKGGIPNRQVASELIKKSDNKIKIRWYDTHGEQFHSKLSFVKKKNNQNQIILGSANLTRRNIDNYNLETNISINTEKNSPLFKDVENYFNLIWNNKENKNFTVDYSTYEDNSFLKKIIYRFQEWSGLSSF
jgi:phosphatidylserine/phosphatidylglycerophosphate/cardiolipin synthase-like enzyme